MFRVPTFLAGAVVALCIAISPAGATPTIGTKAPDFTVTDSHGKTHKLADFAGKTVVLEWSNEGCPFVAKHYNTGNMQALQKKYTGEGVVWLTVISSAQGQQGYKTAEEANAWKHKAGAHSSAVILDPHGQFGRNFDAKTTPHMYVIDKAGTLVYAGAIDDKPTTDKADVAGAKNFVAAALDATLKGQPVPVAETKAYGCSIKYAPGA